MQFEGAKRKSWNKERERERECTTFPPGYPCYRQLFQPRKFSLLRGIGGKKKEEEESRGQGFKIRKVFHYAFVDRSMSSMSSFCAPLYWIRIADVSGPKLVEIVELLPQGISLVLETAISSLSSREKTGEIVWRRIMNRWMDGWMDGWWNWDWLN